MGFTSLDLGRSADMGFSFGRRIRGSLADSTLDIAWKGRIQTYGATDMLVIGFPVQYSINLVSPRRRAVNNASRAVLEK